VRPLLFLAVALAPALNLLPLPRYNSPHYTYFALPALGAAVALAWEALRSRGSSQLVVRAVALLLGAWIATMAVSTFAASYRFRDDRALFGPEVARDPGFREGWHYLGSFFYDAGDLQSAATAFERALAEEPDRIAYVDATSVRIDLAICRLEQGRLQEADQLLVEAAGGAPAELLDVVRFNRALVALRGNRPERVRGLLGPLADGPEASPLELMERARARIEGRRP
jgi:tetratricopeptide (TPR) repeat protein